MILSSYSLSAQTGDIKVTWGEHVPIAKGNKPVGFLGNKEIGYLQLSENSGKSFGLNKISVDLKTQGTDVVEIGEMKKTYLEGVVNLGDKAFLMISAQVKDKVGDCLFAQEVDVKAGKFVGTPKLLIETGGDAEGRMVAVFPMGFRMIDKFKFNENTSNGKFLVSYQLMSSKSNPSPKPNYAMFDQNLKKEWSFENKGAGSFQYGDVYFVNNHVYTHTRYRDTKNW